MNNIIKTDSIDNLNIELKLHILELNIAFAKKTHHIQNIQKHMIIL